MIILGPVIGLVTENTATVLYEVDFSSEVTIIVSSGTESHRYTVPSPSSKPCTFLLPNLKANTRYALTLVDSNTKTGTFTTRLENVYVLSCNNPDKGNMVAWQFLSERPPDILFSIGDQVYKDYVNNTFDTALSAATYIEKVEIFRNKYRQVWNLPLIAQVLSSCSNIMIGDDHDIVDSWDQEIRFPSDWREQITHGWESFALSFLDNRKRTIIAALQAYTEYQLPLSRQQYPGSFLLTIKERIIYMLDVRMSRVTGESLVLQGEDDSLSTYPPDIVISPLPVFLVPTSIGNRVSAKIASLLGLRDICDLWNLHSDQEEEMIPLLKHALLLCGDAHMQGKTHISISDDTGEYSTVQYTTSGICTPVAPKILKALFFLYHKYKRNIGSSRLTIQHEYWSRNNGYLRLKLSNPKRTVEHVIPSLLL